MKHLDIKQIQEIIPHRHPFLLLDYVEDYERVSMQWRTNVFPTGKSSLPDIFHRSRSCRVC